MLVVVVRRLLLTLYALAMFSNLLAQPKVSLSGKHIDRIQEVTQGKDRLNLYRKYYTKDSTKSARKLERSQRKKWDSLVRVTNGAAKLERVVEDMPHIATNFLALDFELGDIFKVQDFDSASYELKNRPHLKKHLKEHYNLSDPEIEAFAKGDTTIRSRVKRQSTEFYDERSLRLSQGQQKQIEILRASYGRYSPETIQYVAFLKDSVDRMDSLTSIAEVVAGRTSESLEGQVGGLADLDKFHSGRSELEALSKSNESYTEQLKDIRNPADLKGKGIDELVQQREGLLDRVSFLKGKFSTLLNSNDLSSGIKAKSLEGVPLRHRWVIGGNFNIVSTAPFMLDLAPQFGYRIDKRFQVGVSGIYRTTFVDTVNWSNAISPQRYGFSAFASYGLIGNFFGYAEWERTANYVKNAADNGSTAWTSSLLVGVGRTFRVHPKVKGSILILGNLLHENGESPYHSPLVVKTGFQLTQLALMKK